MKNPTKTRLAVLTSMLATLALGAGCASHLPAARAVGAPPAPAATSCPQTNVAVGDYFGRINWLKQNHPELAEILKKFPKGADLHNHLSGSITPEEYLAFGGSEGDCFGLENVAVPNVYTIKSATAPGVCPGSFKLLTQADDQEKKALLQSLSMYEFSSRGRTTVQAGHDQFFATFGRLGAVSGAPANFVPMLAKLLRHAHDDSVSYVETMTSFQSGAVGALANQLRSKYPDLAAFEQPGNYSAMFDYLQSVGLTDAVVAGQKDVATYVSGVNTELKCGLPAADLACAVSYNFQAAVNRNAVQSDGRPDLPKIFTQVALSVSLAAIERRVVGVNLLSGEDSAVSMSTFATQMQFFAHFHRQLPKVNIALHGGELTPCFVGGNVAALMTHITGSIDAGAKRLGHAVSFAFLSDTDKNEVAALMTPNKTLVEVPLASNAQILGVTGDSHPFEQYFRKYKVPVALSTDDEGVSYTDYTSAWLYAVAQFHVTYDDAVRLARASLQYAFIPGEALWLDDSPKVIPQCAGDALGAKEPSESCRRFLSENAKADTQWRYESKLAEFNKEFGESLQKQFKALDESMQGNTQRRASNEPQSGNRP